MITTIVHSAQGCGKSSASAALMRRFSSEVLIDEWDGRTRLPRGALALTNLAVDQFRVSDGTVLISFQRALSLL